MYPSSSVSQAQPVRATAFLAIIMSIIAAMASVPISTGSSGDNGRNGASGNTYASFGIDMTVHPDSAPRGSKVEFAVMFNNTGNATANNIWLNASIAPQLTIVDSSNEANRTNSSWHYQLIDAGINSTLYFNATINSSTPPSTNLQNNMTINYSWQVDAFNFMNGTNATPFVYVWVTDIIQPGVGLGIYADTVVAGPGGTVNYSLSMGNGGGLAKSVVLSIPLPDGMDFVNSTSESTRVGMTWTLGDIPGGAGTGGSNTFLTLMVSPGLASSRVIECEAWLNYSNTFGEPQPGSKARPASIFAHVPESGPAPVPPINITVDKISDVAEAAIGSVITYTLTVDNTDTRSAHNVTLMDTLAQGLVFEGPSDEATMTSIGQWDLGTMAPGATRTIKLMARLDRSPALAGTFVNNTAWVLCDDGEGGVRTATRSPTISVKVRGYTGTHVNVGLAANATSARAGDIIQLTVFYNNSGDGPAMSVDLALLFPDKDLTYITSSAEDELLYPIAWYFENVGGGDHQIEVFAVVNDRVGTGSVQVQAFLSYVDWNNKTGEDSLAYLDLELKGKNATPEDTIPPSITGYEPFQNEVDVMLKAQVVVYFSEPMAKKSAETAFTISPAVEGAFQWPQPTSRPKDSMLKFIPNAELEPDTKYTVTVSKKAKDLAGNNLTDEVTWSFTTEERLDVTSSEGANAEGLLMFIIGLVVGLVLGLVIMAVVKRKGGRKGDGKGDGRRGRRDAMRDEEEEAMEPEPVDGGFEEVRMEEPPPPARRASKPGQVRPPRRRNGGEGSGDGPRMTRIG